ncbi:MAG: 50S ribosomal protein L23 [bacterium]
MDIYSVIRRPILTEKCIAMRSSENKYAFEVARSANKIQIKRAVETIFGVKVKDVKTMVMPGKMRRVRYKEGMTPKWKKAIVTLEQGQKMEAFEQV